MIDQIKTGQYIAGKRKLKNLTQADVAEKLGITDRAVSKWERGLCLPDSSQMLPLCRILDITVSELLSGEDIEEDEIRASAAALILELKRKEEETNRYLLHLEWIIGIISCVSFFIIILLASCIVADISNPLTVLLMALSFAILITGVYYSLRIERTAGYYECKECHNRYVPDMASVMMAPHIGRTRYMKCPSCGKRTWQRKVLSK